MHLKTRGLVLNSLKYGETSVIAKILTEQIGVISFLAKGVRTAKSKQKYALLQPLTLLEIDLDYRPEKGLQYFKDFKMAHTYISLPFEISKSTMSLFLLEVIHKTAKEEAKGEDLFTFIFDCLVFLDELEVMNNNFHLQFLVNYCKFLGFAIQNNYNAENTVLNLQDGCFVKKKQENAGYVPEIESAQMAHILNTNMTSLLPIKLTRSDRKQVLNWLLKYYSLHLGSTFEIQSHEILEAVFDD